MSNPRRKSSIRIRGNDRALMMVCRDTRRRWFQYGENRIEAYKRAESKIKRHEEKFYICQKCKDILKKDHVQIDHIKPLGSRPRKFNFVFLAWMQHMFVGRCELLCKRCHKEKTDAERKKRQDA